MSDKKNIGNMGEDMACDFLEKEGYTIIKNNYRKTIGEIDIVAKKNNTIHFIEVKTRSLSSLETFGLPQDAVSRSKQKK